MIQEHQPKTHAPSCFLLPGLSLWLVPGGGVEPPRPEGRRILSSLVGSEPFGKFSTLFDFSTAYKPGILIGYDHECMVLSIELLQFYYSSVLKLAEEVNA